MWCIAKEKEGLLIFKSLAVGPLQVNCFILACEETREGIVVDPGDNVPAILELLVEDDIRVVEIVGTHGHFDHIGRVDSLKRETGAPFAVHEADLPVVKALSEVAPLFGLETDPPPDVDRFLVEGDAVRFGKEDLEVIHTPGHAPGNISLSWPGHVIVGDILFAGSVGRTDFEGGDMGILLQSVREKLFPLGDETQVYPGHGPSTTIGEERRTNPFITQM